MKYDIARQFYLRIKKADLPSNGVLPEIFTNIFPSKNCMECQTLDLIKYNQKIKDAHNEIVSLSDTSIQSLIEEVRTRIHILYKISEAIALLDLLSTFAQHASTNGYCAPEITPDVLAFQAARHPIRALIQTEQFIPNDVYATSDHKRFQIITGCNMSGKSTYIRSICLIAIMAQIGSFVPAEYASLPIVHELFARISTDDCLEANVSTFANEMHEMAFILRSLTPASLIIVDELGRGTSTTDGLSIAIAIAEALIQSKAIVFFVTHFHELPRILSERAGVYNMHMNVDIEADFSRMRMRYKISEGQEEQKYYGLALAQLLDLPDEVMEVAVATSKQLNDDYDARRSNVKLIAIARRRKLALHVRETLEQARDAKLAGPELLIQLQKLQHEFLLKMSAVDEVVLETEEDEDLFMSESITDCYVRREDDCGLIGRHDINADMAEQDMEQSTWEAAVLHENHLLRPMPTDSSDFDNRINRQPTDSDTRPVTSKGSTCEDPIDIEDWVTERQTTRCIDETCSTR